MIKHEEKRVLQAKIDKKEREKDQFAKGVNAEAPVDPDDERDWGLYPPILDPEPNHYAIPYVVRSDLIFKVSRFGYKRKDITKNIVNNLASHQATTYYLLEKDHEHIC